jgi:hypothetical protein
VESLKAGKLRNFAADAVADTAAGATLAFERQFLPGELQVELVPQGMLAERLRAGRVRPARVQDQRRREVDRAAHGPRGGMTTTTDTPRARIITRTAREITDGMVVSVGIGLPTLLADTSMDHRGVLLQSKNGMLGIGPYPTDDQVDADLINAGKETVTALAGTSLDSADSFAMIRGGHVDLAILGGMEVSAAGDLANWTIPGRWSRAWAGRWTSSSEPSGSSCSWSI